MTFPTLQVVFYCFSALLIGAAIMVITSRNPVRALLFLILAFFASAVLWMLVQAEFLSLMLIFVYVGAVMTLFLFVIMMLNVDVASLKDKFVRFLPFSVLAFMLLVAAMILVVGPKHLSIASVLPIHPADYSNTKALGTLMFTKYVFEFEVAAAILLVAMVSAIGLAFFGRKPNMKTQDMNEQHSVKKQDRIRIVKMKAEQS